MDETNELIKQRIKNIEELKEMGVKPYGDPFSAEDHAADVLNKYQAASKEELEEKTVTCSLAGRIVAFRDFGKAAFAHIQDGTGRIQIYLKRDVLGDRHKLLKK